MHYDHEYTLCMYVDIHVCMFPCTGKEWMRGTGGLLAQSAGGRNGGIEGKEGAAG